MVALDDPTSSETGKYAIALDHKDGAAFLGRLPPQPRQVGVSNLLAWQARRSQSALVLLQLYHGRSEVGQIGRLGKSNDDLAHFCLLRAKRALDGLSAIVPRFYTMSVRSVTG